MKALCNNDPTITTKGELLRKNIEQKGFLCGKRLKNDLTILAVQSVSTI